MASEVRALTPSRTCSSYVLAGAVHGVAAWSAYALVEFVFSSVLFRVTRPYSLFTAWHWSLTGMLILAFLAVGFGFGSLAGLLVWRQRDAATVRAYPSHALELAATLSVPLAFLLHVGLTQGTLHAGFYLQLDALLFIVLIGAALVSEEWMKRLGLLTNYWVVTGMLLGLGQFFGLNEMYTSTQLGVSVGLYVKVAGFALLAAAVLAVLVGRGGRFAADRRLTAATVILGVGLTVVSFALSFGDQADVHAAAPTLTASPRPNVVLIVMDTVRADHISAIGYDRDTTPRLKQLAADSVVYANAEAASDITITSHASLFTGMYPSWHGAYCQPPEAIYGRELAKTYPTLAELMQASGYETIGVAANLYLRSDFGLERGFEEFRIPRPVPLLPDGTPYLLRRTMRRGLSFLVDTAQFDRLYSFGEDIDSTLFSAVGQRRKPSAPLFVFMNYMDAHFPYVPPAPYNTQFPGKRARMTQDILEAEQTIITTGHDQPAEYRPHCVSQYDGGIAYMDAQVGRVVDWLKRENAYDNTMIVVASDHGESFGERSRVGHANSPYQNLLHVPLLVKFPRGGQTGVERRPVSLIDVAPSILAAAQAPVPATMQGRNLAAAGEPRVLYGETFPCPVMQPPVCPGGCTAKAIIAWPMKYISSSNGKRELFDLSNDPNEQTNLFIRQQERATQLDGDLTAWRKNLPTQTRQTKEVDPEKLKQLKGLGYIQ
jgi:arylsulfatase A-like enzyme